MSKSRRRAILLLVVGGALIGAGAASYRRAGRAIQVVDVEAAVAARDSTRAQLRDTSLRYQGLMRSGASIPDSIRVHDAGVIWRQTQDYEKEIYVLESKEEQQNLRVTKLKQQREAARRRQLAVTTPLAAVGAVVTLVGAVLLARSRPRPVAA